MPDKEGLKQGREKLMPMPPLAGFGFLNYSVETLIYFVLFVIDENTDINLKKELGTIKTIKGFISFTKQMRQLAIGNKQITVFGKSSNQNLKLLDDVLEYLSSDKNYSNMIRTIDNIFDNFLNSSVNRLIRVQLIELPDRPSRLHASTNQSISNLSIKILDEVNDDAVLDVCSTFGSFLCRYAFDGHANKFYGIEINALLCLIARIKLAVIGVDSHISCGDIFEMRLDRSFKKIFCDPPFGVRLPIDMRRKIFMKKEDIMFSMGTSSEWMYLLNALEYLEISGKMVAVVPCGALINIKDCQMRETLVTKGLIESVIELPSDALLGSNVGVSLVIFSHDNSSIKFVDAKGIGFLPRESRFLSAFDYEKVYELYKSSENDCIRDVACNDIIANNSLLLPSRYTGASLLINHLPHAVQLGTIVSDIYRGYQITAAERSKFSVSPNSKNSVKVLTVSDIKYSNISDKLDSLAPNGKFRRYYLRNGDIVISAKGDRAKVAVVNNSRNTPIFPNGSLIVIRLKEGYDPYYVCAFLESQIGEMVLDQIRTGSSIKSINTGSLAEIKIPFLPKKSERDRISNEYKMSISMIKSFSEKLEDLKNNCKSMFDWISAERN